MEDENEIRGLVEASKTLIYFVRSHSDQSKAFELATDAFRQLATTRATLVITTDSDMIRPRP